MRPLLYLPFSISLESISSCVPVPYGPRSSRSPLSPGGRKNEVRPLLYFPFSISLETRSSCVPIPHSIFLESRSSCVPVPDSPLGQEVAASPFLTVPVPHAVPVPNCPRSSGRPCSSPSLCCRRGEGGQFVLVPRTRRGFGVGCCGVGGCGRGEIG